MQIHGYSCNYSFVEQNLSSFFDGGLDLTCLTGSCTTGEVPQTPLQPSGLAQLVGISFLIVSLLVVVAVCIFYFVQKRKEMLSLSVQDSEVTETFFNRQSESQPTAKVSFSGISYSIPSTGDRSQILHSASGIAEPGQVLAVMGPSGSGKTTLLEILAGCDKIGAIQGHVFVNDRICSGKAIRKRCAFVHQSDLLLETLTVRESLMYSALLRLPESMPLRQKKRRVSQVLCDLSLIQIADSLIGSMNAGGISGGERRRLMIAQELVSYPQILFLDEPTSGLDASNALSVMNTIKNLATHNRTTVILTIHQPRSNIFNLFDSLILLADGYQIYFGSASAAMEYFFRLGFTCPSTYNVADFLVDLCAGDSQVTDSIQTLSSKFSSTNQELQNSVFSQVSLDNPIFVDILAPQNKQNLSFRGQLLILCGRSLLNVTRNPNLLFTHYFSSFFLAIFCGVLYWRVTDDMPGVQNRLGCLFFSCAFFSLSSLSSLESFAVERLLFKRERNSCYYSTGSFYLSKLICDLLPLRVVPAVIFGSVVYVMAGFVATVENFFKFLSALVLFNLSATGICLCLGIAIKDFSVASLVANIFMLFSMLFGGFLLNKDRMVPLVRWLKVVSIFNYAYEAMIVNELTKITLKDSSVVDLRIPGSVILRQFGFNVNAYTHDIFMQGVIFAVSIALGYFLLTLV